jgi:hypothetical protein
VKRNKRDITKLARRYGRRVEELQGHFKLVCERGERPTIFCASTPKNTGHWLAAVERDLRRYDQPKESH